MVTQRNSDLRVSSSGALAAYSAFRVKRAFLAIVLLAVPVCADEVLMKGGGRLTGQISSQTEEAVTIDIGAGTMTVPMSSVVDIKRGASPLAEYRDRAAKLSPDAIEGWRELGRWANRHGLSVQAHEAYRKVRAANPNDLDANRALGLVLYEGTWMSEEDSYKARGYVKHGSDWMSPAERDAMIRERDATEEANRQQIAAVVDASVKAQKEQEEKERLEDEERRQRNQLPTLGDWNWGWGYAIPTVMHD